MEDKRTNPEQMGRELGMQFYRYSGGTIMSTREFCSMNAGKYFQYKEVMNFVKSDWVGKHPETDENNIFKYVGGYCKEGDHDETCDHKLMPVSERSVPKEVLLRNIEKGYYKPSETIKKMLGL